jgi:hypothetical protein
MSKPFNYYQYEGTGAGQYITPFPTHFSGFFIPPGVLEGGDVGFIIRTADDDSLRPTTFATKVYGSSLPTQNLNTQYYVQMSGNVFPVSSDSGDYSFRMTGNVAQFPYDTATLDSVFTGSLAQDNTDLSYYSVGFNFDYEGGLNILNYLSFTVSGNFAPATNDSYDYGVYLSGKLRDTPLDRASINLVFSGITFGTGASFINYSVSDQATINVEWSKILFSVA